MKYMGNQEYWDQKFLGRTEQLPPEPLLVEEFSLFTGKRTVLDLACGDGRNALYLAERGMEVTAVDFSLAGLARLRRFAAQQGLSIATKQAELSMPEELNDLGEYDVILCNHYRLPQRTAALLREKLKGDGIFWINGFSKCPPDNPGIGPQELIKRQDYLAAGYALLSEKEYQVGDRCFVRLLFSKSRFPGKVNDV